MAVSVRSSVEANGFAIIEQFLGAKAILDLARQIDHSNLSRSRAGIRHALCHSAFVELALDPVLLGIASDVLGARAIPFHATLFDKSPQSNWLVVWHQDTALPLRGRRETPGWGPWSVKDGVNYAHAPAEALRKVVALRVHIDESNHDNGPLRVLSGTQRLGVLTDTQVDKLVQRSTPTTCAVPAGGVLAMRPLLVHSSSKSHSDLPRRVLHIEYAESLYLGDSLELASDHEMRSQ